jgi:hypothetical protein
VSSGNASPKKVITGPISAAGVGLTLGDGVSVRVGVRVRDAVAVPAGRVGEVVFGVRCGVGVELGETVNVGRTGVGVRVGRGVKGVDVGMGVNVGGTGPVPTRTINCLIGPRLPRASRSRRLTV